VPSLFHALGLGVWWRHFHQAALVVTDRRLIDLLMDARGRRTETRTLSYAWAQAKAVRMRGSKLRFTPRQGRTQSWVVSQRGDRRLLKLLVPRISEQRLGIGAEPARPVPVWHCPVCGMHAEAHPSHCVRCRTQFRSPAFAAWIALALPGGGLFYTGHPVLGALDLIGEAIVAVIVAATLLMSAGIEEFVAGIVTGLALFAITKLESIHLSHLFATRTRPERSEVRRRWTRLAAAGAVLSLAVIATPVAFRGTLAGTIERDIEPVAADLGWDGSFEPAAWVYGADAGQRSEWIAQDGLAVFLYAFPLGPFETFADVQAALTADGGALAEPLTPIADEVGFDGLRAVARQIDQDGQELLLIRYYVFDEESRDVHVISANASRQQANAADEEVRTLLRRARWVSARR
jgi:hypothetical protein